MFEKLKSKWKIHKAMRKTRRDIDTLISAAVCVNLEKMEEATKLLCAHNVNSINSVFDRIVADVTATRVEDADEIVQI